MHFAWWRLRKTEETLLCNANRQSKKRRHVSAGTVDKYAARWHGKVEEEPRNSCLCFILLGSHPRGTWGVPAVMWFINWFKIFISCLSTHKNFKTHANACHEATVFFCFVFFLNESKHAEVNWGIWSRKTVARKRTQHIFPFALPGWEWLLLILKSPLGFVRCAYVQCVILSSESASCNGCEWSRLLETCCVKWPLLG